MMIINVFLLSVLTWYEASLGQGDILAMTHPHHHIQHNVSSGGKGGAPGTGEG